MSSETGDGDVVTVSLPADLREWLAEQARTLGVDEEAMVRQLLASYQAAEELDGDLDGEEFVTAKPDQQAVEEAVRRTLRNRLDDIVAAVEERMDDGSEVEAALRADLQDAESRFGNKLDDVRQRVIQVKRETDAKAPEDHTHEEFDRIDDRIDDVEETLSALREEVGDVDDRLDDTAGDVDDIDGRLDDVEEKLRTVAWVVSDLRDTQESQQGTTKTVERIKRGAAEADIERARCENCGEGVTISLLTDPECPHCNATVTEVEPADGFFGKPKLAVAKQLESGEETRSDREVPDAARRT